MKWEEKRLDQLGELGRGKSRHRPRNDVRLYGGEFPFVQTSEIQNANFRITEFKATYSSFGLAQSKLWPSGTLCISIVGANTAATAILGFDACFPDSVIGFNGYQGVANNYFIKYLIDTRREEFYRISQGTARENLSMEKLLSMPLTVPPFIIQQKIASILSAYDDLIENNLKRIRVLEEAAQNLYREWFVQFRFPGYEAVEFVDGLPKGWERRSLDDVLTFKTGKLDSNAAVENGMYPFFTCSQEVFKTNTYSFEMEAVLLGGNNASGIYPLKYYDGKFDAYQRTYIIQSKNGGLSQKYIYLYFFNQLEYLRNVSTGAATKFLTLRLLSQIKILLPEIQILAEFDRIVTPIFLQIRNLNDANEKLKVARDILLPRLMNQTIEV